MEATVKRMAPELQSGLNSDKERCFIDPCPCSRAVLENRMEGAFPENAHSDVDARHMAKLENHFWLSWNTHKEYLKKLSIVWMNVSASDAEDAFSEATIRAFEKYRSSSNEISNERAWFARLLHNICIDRHRANTRQKKLRENIKELDSQFFPIKESAIATPEAELINEELKTDIFRSIEELPERLKRPLIMRLVQEEDYDDIARELDISNDNARKRVQQARAHLRSSLAHHKQ